MNTKRCQSPNNKFGVMNGLDFQIPLPIYYSFNKVVMIQTKPNSTQSNYLR